MSQFDYSKETKEDLIRYIEKIDFILMFNTHIGGFLHGAGERYTMEQRIEMLKIARFELKEYRDAREKTSCCNTPPKRIDRPSRPMSLRLKLRYLRHSLRSIGWL
jgi:hypothetical protein